MEWESDDEADHFDTVCAICDNGGELICCEGKCFRSFHATRESLGAQDSYCYSLCPPDGSLKKGYKCENCQYNLHQCFACGELGSSDNSSNTEVFQCSDATCGHFYHPKCVAKLLQKDNEAEPQALEKGIAGGDPFMCPAHNCAVCKQTENEMVEELQFAVCRRCPTSYHRKCIPRSIMFEDECDDHSIPRAWDDLLPKSRALMYCRKHKIIKGLGTPARTLKLRNVCRRKTDQPSYHAAAGPVNAPAPPTVPSNGNLQSGVTSTLGQETVLLNAFSTMTLQDPTTRASNMDTGLARGTEEDATWELLSNGTEEDSTWDLLSDLGKRFPEFNIDP